jgi:hypothetical protein
MSATVEKRKAPLLCGKSPQIGLEKGSPTADERGVAETRLVEIREQHQLALRWTELGGARTQGLW